MSLDRGLPDIDDNFYIAHGAFYEGRGFNATGYGESFSIGFLSCTRNEFMTEAMNSILREGWRLGLLASNGTLSFEIFECPT